MGTILTAIYKFASSRLIFPTNVPLQFFCPGDWVLLKYWKTKHPEDQSIFAGPDLIRNDTGNRNHAVEENHDQ